MAQPIDMYWKIKLAEVKEQLESNNFEVTIADSLSDAKTLVLEKFIPELKPQRISWGGSMTFVASGLYDALKDTPDMEVVDTFDKSLSNSEMLERKRAPRHDGQPGRCPDIRTKACHRSGGSQ